MKNYRISDFIYVSISKHSTSQQGKLSSLSIVQKRPHNVTALAIQSSNVAWRLKSATANKTPLIRIRPQLRCGNHIAHQLYSTGLSVIFFILDDVSNIKLELQLHSTGVSDLGAPDAPLSANRTTNMQQQVIPHHAIIKLPHHVTSDFGNSTATR